MTKRSPGRARVSLRAPTGITFGGTLGYNYQFAPHWLVGVEGEFGRLGLDRSFKEWDDIIVAGSKASSYATIRGRVGYVTGPSLLYVTGGVAFVNITDSFGGTIPQGLPPTVNTTTKTGFTVGTGIETKLSRNWSATTEYQFLQAGSTNFASTVFGVPGVPTSFDHSYHLVKSGLNYKLDGNWDGVPFFGTLLPSDHNWAGLYAGFNAGGGMSAIRAFNPGTNPGGETDPRGVGFAGGGQVGYNYLFMNRWLAGVEADIGKLGVNATVDDWFDTNFARFHVDTEWYATLRGRFGTSTGPALLYVTAGAAWVQLTDGFAPTGFGVTGDLNSRTAAGWTVGGGTEVALDARWSARLEVLYIDVGDRQHQVAPAAFFADFKDHFMVVRGGLNYQLGGL